MGMFSSRAKPWTAADSDIIRTHILPVLTLKFVHNVRHHVNIFRTIGDSLWIIMAALHDYRASVSALTEYATEPKRVRRQGASLPELLARLRFGLRLKVESERFNEPIL
jgi:hypothetical protein